MWLALSGACPVDELDRAGAADRPNDIVGKRGQRHETRIRQGHRSAIPAPAARCTLPPLCRASGPPSLVLREQIVLGSPYVAGSGKVLAHPLERPGQRHGQAAAGPSFCRRFALQFP